MRPIKLHWALDTSSSPNLGTTGSKFRGRSFIELRRFLVAPPPPHLFIGCDPGDSDIIRRFLRFHCATRYLALGIAIIITTADKIILAILNKAIIAGESVARNRLVAIKSIAIDPFHYSFRRHIIITISFRPSRKPRGCLSSITINRWSSINHFHLAHTPPTRRRPPRYYLGSITHSDLMIRSSHCFISRTYSSLLDSIGRLPRFRSFSCSRNRIITVPGLRLIAHLHRKHTHYSRYFLDILLRFKKSRHRHRR